MIVGVNIKTINDESFHLSLEHDTKIYDVKSNLKERTRIAEDRQRLIYKGRVLQDDKVLEDYQIEDGHTIHMVARPSDYEALQQRMQSETSSTAPSLQTPPQNATTLQTLLALSALSGAGAGAGAPGSGVGLDSFGGGGNDISATHDGQNLDRSLEAIRQGLLTTHTFMSMAANHEKDVEGVDGLSPLDNEMGKDNKEIDEKEDVEENEISVEEMLGKRTFFLGQWLDVKDTVNQWLEATVMDIDYEGKRVFVHYNGWPPRWDEWVAFSSDRVTPFRTRTANVTTSQASPMPSNLVASAPQTGPVSGGGDVRHLVPELHRLLQGMLPLLSDAAHLCAQDREADVKGESTWSATSCLGSKQDQNRREKTEEGGILYRPWLSSSAVAELSPPPGQQKNQVREQEKCCEDKESDCSAFESSRRQRLQEQQFRRLTRELAPLLDRLGRCMTDVAPHLLNLESSLQQPHSSSDLNGGRSDTVRSGNPSSGSAARSVEGEGEPRREEEVEVVDDEDGRRQLPQQTTMERLLESLSLGVSPLQRGSASVTPPTYRPLVTRPAAPSGRGGLLGRGNHLDIHIHAIVAPSRGQPSELGDSSGISTSTSPAPSPTSTLSASHPSSSLLFPSSTTERSSSTRQQQDQTNLAHSGHSSSGDDNGVESSDDDDSDNVDDEDDDDYVSRPRSSLLPEEEERQQQRRQAWAEGRAIPSQDRDRDRLQQSFPLSSAVSSTSLQDDIEELYDANFGEHFRRLHFEQEQTQAHGGQKDDSVAGEGHSTENVSNYKEVDEKNIPGYAMPSTYSHYATSTNNAATTTVKHKKQKKSIKSASACGNDIDPVTLSNLEREVALLAEQTHLQGGEGRVGKRGQECAGGDGGRDGGAEEFEARRRRKSGSFVQRVRRSLSSLSSSSQKKNEASATGKANKAKLKSSKAVKSNSKI